MPKRKINLSNLAVGFARAHYDGRQRGYWVGVLAMTAYYLLSPIVGTWLALVPLALATAAVYGKRPS